MAPSSYKMLHTHAPLSIDPKEIRQHLRALIRHQYNLHHRDAVRQTHTLINEIWQFVELASRQLQEEKHPQALSVLQAVTDVVTTQWMYLNDLHGEVSAFFQELARVWTEALLLVDLTTKERHRWAKQVTVWQTRLSMCTAFDAPLAALREGWEYPPLQRILQGTSLEQGTWEGEIPPYAQMLTQARLTVLEQREQVQEYLYLAKAEKQTRAYVTMLVRQGQIAEAISYGYQSLATAEDAFALAQALLTHGERSQSLEMAAHGLTLAGDRVPLAIWLRDHAWSMGNLKLALEASEIAFRGEPTLEQYLHVARIAGTHWPEYRSRLLDDARHAPFTADPKGLLRLFLHEHLFDDAIAVVEAEKSYGLVAQVVDAALKEQTALEWVIGACRQQAEYIMNGAKAAYYPAAATWLTKARTAYHLVGRDEAWHAYLGDLLEQHKYKSKLLPLLRALQ